MSSNNNSTYPRPSSTPLILRERDIEDAFIGKLRRLKYTYRPDIQDRAALEANFRRKFETLNRVILTDGEFDLYYQDIRNRIKSQRFPNADLPGKGAEKIDLTLVVDMLLAGFDPEQHKIASCLSSLDDLIAAESRQLDTLRAHKKGIMQQLFPSPEATGATRVSPLRPEATCATRVSPLRPEEGGE